MTQESTRHQHSSCVVSLLLSSQPPGIWSECLLCQIGLSAADTAPSTGSWSSQPKETGSDWLLATIESRCQMCPVIRKILQFWHSLRAERQKQPIMEGESSTQAVPEASNHRHSLLHGGCGGPGSVGHGLELLWPGFLLKHMIFSRPRS